MADANVELLAVNWSRAARRQMVHVDLFGIGVDNVEWNCVIDVTGSELSKVNCRSYIIVDGRSEEKDGKTVAWDESEMEWNCAYVRNRTDFKSHRIGTNEQMRWAERQSCARHLFVTRAIVYGCVATNHPLWTISFQFLRLLRRCRWYSLVCCDFM